MTLESTTQHSVIHWVLNYLECHYIVLSSVKYRAVCWTSGTISTVGAGSRGWFSCHSIPVELDCEANLMSLLLFR